MFGNRFTRNMKGLQDCPNFAAPSQSPLKNVCPNGMNTNKTKETRYYLT